MNKLKQHREVENIGLSIAECAKDLTITDVYLAAENLFSSSSNQLSKSKQALILTKL